MLLKLIFLIKHAFLDQGFRVGYKVVLFEEHVMTQEPKSPNIHFWSIRLLSENLWRHKDWSAYNLFINLFLYRKPEISQLVQCVSTLFLQENIVGLEISMNYVVSRHELNSASKLIHDLERFRLRESSIFVNDLVKISIRTKLKNHGNVILCEEAIVNFGCEHSVRVIATCQLQEYIDFAV